MYILHKNQDCQLAKVRIFAIVKILSLTNVKFYVKILVQ